MTMRFFLLNRTSPRGRVSLGCLDLTAAGRPDWHIAANLFETLPAMLLAGRSLPNFNLYGGAPVKIESGQRLASRMPGSMPPAVGPRSRTHTVGRRDGASSGYAELAIEPADLVFTADLAGSALPQSLSRH